MFEPKLLLCFFKTYSHIAAGSHPLVLLLRPPPVQLGPQTICPPIVKAAFNRSVQWPFGSARFQLQMFTKLAEGVQRRPAGWCWYKLIKQLLSLAFWERLVFHGDLWGCRAPWEGCHLLMMSPVISSSLSVWWKDRKWNYRLWCLIEDKS